MNGKGRERERVSRANHESVSERNSSDATGKRRIDFCVSIWSVVRAPEKNASNYSLVV